MAKVHVYKLDRSGHLTPVCTLTDETPKPTRKRRVLREWVKRAGMVILVLALVAYLGDAVIRVMEQAR